MRSIDTRCALRLKSLSRVSPKSWRTSDLWGAVAREVVEFYGDKFRHTRSEPAHFALRLASIITIVLERNPTYRDVVYDEEPNASDQEGQALLQKFKGRRLPMLDRVEITIIEEVQPRWLSFLNREQDLMYLLPYAYMDIAAPNGKLAPSWRGKTSRCIERLPPTSAC